MVVAWIPRETKVTVIGSMNEITTGFDAVIQEEGWQCSEISDVSSLFDRPFAPHTLIALPIDVFTVATYGLVRHLASRLGSPVIVFSRERDPMIVSALLRAGAEDVIHIPITIEEMLARLRAVIRVCFGAHDPCFRMAPALKIPAREQHLTGSPEGVHPRY